MKKLTENQKNALCYAQETHGGELRLRPTVDGRTRTALNARGICRGSAVTAFGVKVRHDLTKDKA